MIQNILVIDAQGGGIGRQLISELAKKKVRAHILAVGTNATATAQMLKAGADHGATGENPVIAGSRNADIIIGPVGIVIADSMFGEITPAMAVAVGQSNAEKILIPVTNCGNHVVGTGDSNLKDNIEEAVNLVVSLLARD